MSDEYEINKEELVDDVMSGTVIVDERISKTFMTKAASEMLSQKLKKPISEQMLRNYTADYRQFLEITRRQRDGAVYYTEELVDKIADIIKLKDHMGLDKKQMINYLSKQELIARTNEEATRIITKETMDAFRSAIHEEISGFIEQYAGNTVLLTDALKEKNNIIDEIQKKNEKLMQHSDELIGELIESNKQLTVQIAKLQDETEKLRNESQKKRSWFSFGQKK